LKKPLSSVVMIDPIRYGEMSAYGTKSGLSGPTTTASVSGSGVAGAPSFFGTSTLTTIDSLPGCLPSSASTSGGALMTLQPSMPTLPVSSSASRSAKSIFAPTSAAKVPFISKPCRCGTSAGGMLVSSFAHGTFGTVNASAICGTTSSLRPFVNLNVPAGSAMVPDSRAVTSRTFPSNFSSSSRRAAG
jgi:hypothetical protein